MCETAIVPFKSLKNDAPYQRLINYSKFKELEILILSEGYVPKTKITIRGDGRIVDGKHRYLKLDELMELKKIDNIKYLEVIILDFKDYQSEVDYFLRHNDWVNKISPPDLWHALKEADHELAKGLYKLNYDSDSKFYDMIALKDTTNIKEKFTIQQALSIISIIGLWYSTHWNKSHNNSITNKYIEIGYFNVVLSTNRFLNFFYRAFGMKTSQSASLAYGSMYMKSIATVYRGLEGYGLLQTTAKRNRAIKQFSKAKFGEYTDKRSVILNLVSLYNGSKKKKQWITQNDIGIQI